MVGGYLEDVYKRWETRGFNIKWLQGFNNRPPNNVFEESGIELYDQHNLSEEAKRTSNPIRLIEIQELLYPQEESPLKNEAISFIQDKLGNVAKKTKETFEKDINSTNEYNDLQKIKKDINSSPVYLDEYKQELLDKAELKQKRVGEEVAVIQRGFREEEAKQKETDKINRRKEDIQNEISSIDNISDVQRIKSRIERLSDETDTSNLDSQIEGIKISLEEQREENTRKQKEEALNSSDRRKRENASRWLREHKE